MIRTAALLILLMMGFGVEAQPDTATIMCYNLLNFPTFNLAGREDTLRQIVNYVKPDILLLQELKTDSGLQLILNESFADLDGPYAATTFVPQQSNAGSGFRLQQAMVYNSDMFGLVEEGYLETATRDINRFKMYYKDADPLTYSDTLYFYVFVTHFKSSQGSDNEQRRLEMAQTFTLHQQYLPENAPVIFAGDLNLYSSNEPAYQELLDPSNPIVMKDPINTPGVWSSSSFGPRSVHTQSTRASSIFGDGAGGGVDDRFDFILLSDDMLQPWARMSYCADSYLALGNTGTCYNQSITACQNGTYPDALLRSLYYMSDHLPVVLQLALQPGQRTATATADALPTVTVYPNPAHDLVRVRADSSAPFQVEVFDVHGRLLQMHRAKGQLLLNLADLPDGLYLLRVQMPSGVHTHRLLKTNRL